MSAVSAVTSAPAEAVGFVRHKWIAALFVVAVLLVAIVAIEARKPGAVLGRVRGWVRRIPVVGVRIAP